jgi:hypothetical protein
MGSDLCEVGVLTRDADDTTSCDDHFVDDQLKLDLIKQKNIL